MATFSTNQARQFYVANSYVAAGSSLSATGAISAEKKDNCLYLRYMGVDGQMRSDLIPIDSITYAKVTADTAMATTAKSFQVVLDTTINSGAPVAGEDYLLKLNIKQYVGLGEEYSRVVFGEVHAFTGLSASNFYKKLAISLAKNLSKEVSPLVKVYVGTSSANTEVTASTTEASLTGTYVKLVITEVEQPWILGTFEQTPVDFTVSTAAINTGSGEAAWGVVTPVASGVTFINGKKIADMEYFYMGERGDVYRNVGWPNSIKTTYLVDSTKAYSVIDIHFAYQGTCEDIQKSEKDITIVAPKGAGNAAYTLIDSISAGINAATGFGNTDPRHLAALTQG